MLCNILQNCVCIVSAHLMSFLHLFILELLYNIKFYNERVLLPLSVFKVCLLTHQANIFELQHNYTFAILHYMLGLRKCKCESRVIVKALIH